MGLFNFYKKKERPEAVKAEAEDFEIPKEVFIEEKEPQQERQENSSTSDEEKGLDAIYHFLQADYEAHGYSDALTNADESYKTDNIKLIRFDLQILIQKAKVYYNDMVRELDFHINTRERAGLIDTVEELKTRKEMVIEHIEKVEEISQSMDTPDGLTQRTILSYQRGFMRGLAALTQSNILNKKI